MSKLIVVHFPKIKGRGEVISTREGIEVSCGEGSLIVEELQYEEIPSIKRV